MRRVRMAPRPDWQARCEDVGFSYHTLDAPYWNESVAYEFTLAQVEHLEHVTEELHALALDTVDWIVRTGDYGAFGLSAAAVGEIERAWRAGEPSLYGRFDFSWDGRGEPKLLEYNADTPTSLLEASVVQWFWVRDVLPQADQFNSLHEKLIARWAMLRRQWPPGARLHLAAMAGSEEDLGNLGYLFETASQAGIECALLAVEDIGLDRARGCYVDLAGERITHCFKLYPWEWLLEDRFASHLAMAGTTFIEPAWKLLLSSKAILPLLWARHPGHPNLLPAAFAPTLPLPWVRKPIHSREGANVQLALGHAVIESDGPYTDAGWIWQAAAPLPCMDGRYPAVTSWVVGDDAAGLGIREDATPITRDSSEFVPHYFV